MNAQPVSHFSLRDHDGRAVTEADFFGRSTLVYFGFTHCRVVCPRSLSKLSTVLADLGEMSADVVALYITVDPERDTPAVMKSYLQEKYPRFLGLTGTQGQIDEAKRSFRVFAERKAAADEPEGYVVPHTAIAYLMGPDGRYLAHFADHLDASQIKERLGSLLVDLAKGRQPKDS